MELLLLDSGSVRSYAWMTLPSRRVALLSATADGPVFAVGCRVFGSPVGLILARREENRSASVLSLFVHKDFRNRGVAAALMERLEEELVDRGCTKIHAEYKMDAPCVPALERIFRKLHWENPEPYLLRCRLQGDDVHRLMRSPWMSGYRLPSEFEIYPWIEATNDDRDDAGEIVRSLGLHGTVRFLDPVAFDPLRFDPLNSLGLRHKGKTIGCTLTRRVGPGLMSYDWMFVAREFQRTARGPLLLAEAVKRHVAHDRDHPNVGGVWSCYALNAPMVAFVKRRVGPYITHMDETKISVKLLDARSGESSTTQHDRAAMPIVPW